MANASCFILILPARERDAARRIVDMIAARAAHVNAREEHDALIARSFVVPLAGAHSPLAVHRRAKNSFGKF
jgi:hypothetical protein